MSDPFMPAGVAGDAKLGVRSLPWPLQLGIVLGLCVLVGIVLFAASTRSAAQKAQPTASSDRSLKPFTPTPAQLATFTIKRVEERVFQSEHVTEGKISVDDDRTTPIFSPYSGRVIRLLARQGDLITRGQVLFTIEATEMVQANNDLVAASGALNKARSQLQLQQTVEKRQRELFEAKAIALKEWQSAQNELVTAQNDLRGAEGTLEAVRNRLVILGKTEAEIGASLEKGKMSPETPIQSPIAGTVIQRKVGPGQLVTGNASDPAFTVGDLSSVWLIAQVREPEAPNIKVGQLVRFRVLALPDRTFEARVTYVAAAIDPATRRIQVRAQVDNAEGLLKPEMFASVSIAEGVPQTSPAVPREAVIYEADTARLWVVTPSDGVELRQVRTGLANGQMLQVTSGVATGERVVTKGSLFIDRLASGDGH